MQFTIALIILALIAMGLLASKTGSILAQVSGDVNETGVNVYKSDGSLTGSTITNDTGTWPGDDKLWQVCAAVALAEGYNKGAGVAPYDLNNPGDLSPGDESGEQVSMPAQYHGGSNVIVFDTAEGGWRALYAKFQRIVTGKSSTYPATLTWEQIAQKYAGNWQNWLTNITNYLGVDPSSTPKDYVNG